MMTESASTMKRFIGHSADCVSLARASLRIPPRSFLGKGSHHRPPIARRAPPDASQAPEWRLAGPRCDPTATERSRFALLLRVCRIRAAVVLGLRHLKLLAAKYSMTQRFLLTTKRAVHIRPSIAIELPVSRSE